MQDRAVAFVICSNNDLYCDECIWYIDQLNVPEGYEVDIIKITEAESMAQAYNAAMLSSDAKYKVYLHQDVFIYHQDFIEDMIKIFESDEELGMLGMLGGVDLPSNAVTFVAWNRGNVAVCDYRRAYNITLDAYSDVGGIYTKVEAIDGMLMATQYDIKWREDLNLGWDFYDVSQSLEFRRCGYRVGVAVQKMPWCMHDCGASDTSLYDVSRELILKEYRDFFTQDNKFIPYYQQEIHALLDKLIDYMIVYIMDRNWDGAIEIQNKINAIPSIERLKVTNNCLYACNILEICLMERKQNVAKMFLDLHVTDWKAAINKYDSVKLILRHIERGLHTQRVQELQEQIQSGKISKQAVEIIAQHSVIQKESVLNWVGSI